jgi:Ca2+-binding EF-hand superfamily protein
LSFPITLKAYISRMYDADAVLQALLDEWQRRYERNEAHLKALFRAGDTNHDGVMTFDEWKEVIKHANDQMTEREVGVSSCAYSLVVFCG